MLYRHVNIRRWDLQFFFSFDIHDKERILSALILAGAPDSIISQVSENISAGRLNEGFCFSNPRERTSVLGISKATTGPEILDTIAHEIVHAATAIAEEDGLSLKSEAFAYLAGDISHEVSDIVCELSCPKCGRK